MRVSCKRLRGGDGRQSLGEGRVVEQDGQAPSGLEQKRDGRRAEGDVSRLGEWPADDEERAFARENSKPGPLGSIEGVRERIGVVAEIVAEALRFGGRRRNRRHPERRIDGPVKHDRHARPLAHFCSGRLPEGVDARPQGRRYHQASMASAAQRRAKRATESQVKARVRRRRRSSCRTASLTSATEKLMPRVVDASASGSRPTGSRRSKGRRSVIRTGR